MPSASEKFGVEPSALYFIEGGIIYNISAKNSLPIFLPPLPQTPSTMRT
jgi:hypothetical protein